MQRVGFSLTPTAVTSLMSPSMASTTRFARLLGKVSSTMSVKPRLAQLKHTTKKLERRSRNMQITRKSNWVAAGAMMLGLAFATSVQAEVFTDADLKKYQDEYMASVTRGDDLSHGGIKGNNVACAQCHPNGAN